jgi:Leucine-rich repeat (LRR) protein
MKGMDMKSRIELELRGKDRHTIKELNLDSCRGMQIEGLDDDYKNLEILSLINVGLTTLKGFPKLSSLKKLELSDNRINGGLENLLACPSLTHLNLSGNKIKDLDALAPLAKLKSLKNVDLFNCEVTKLDNYRNKIFNLLPDLKFLDGFDANDEEEDEFEGNESDEDDDEEGVGKDDEDSEEEEGGGVGVEDEDEDEDEDDEDDEDEEEEDDVMMPSNNGLVNENASKANKPENDEDDDEDDDDDDDNENEVGLSYLQKSNLLEEDEENDVDFDEKKANLKNANDDEDDDDEEEEEEEDDEAESSTGGGVKRKLEDDADTN